MPRRLRSRRCIGGFTLLEVLVAFVILLLAFAVLMRIFATGSRGLVATDDVNLAVAFAQADLAMVGVTEPLEAGERNGELGQGYLWERAIAPFPTREEELSANVPSLYQVTTRISWERNGRQRELSLTTLRIGPMPNLAGAGN